MRERTVRSKWLTNGCAAAVAMSLGACSLIPKYERPAAPVDAAWPEGATLRADIRTTTAAEDIGWRQFFTDPALQRLIEVALSNNRDARIAALNVEAARAQYRAQRSALFPSIEGTASQTVTRYPANLFSGFSGGAVGGAGVADAGVTSNDGFILRQYNVGVGFTAYELDVFGRIRSLSEQRLEQYFGYAETQRSAVISLVAEVADAWLTLLADEALLAVTRDTLKSQQDSYDLTRRAYDRETLTALTLRQAQTSVDTARANLAAYQRRVVQDRNALVLLIGAPLPRDLPGRVDIADQDLLEDLPADVPSEVLQRRPDVLAAEHNLRAANANIGAARAAFFPSISLTGSYGTASSRLSGLFDSGSRTWTWAPTITLPIFVGANFANLDLAEILKNVYVAQYEQAIQTAFREVADSLASRALLNDQLAAQASLEDATRDAYRLADLRFRTGIDSYLTVLDSQRALYQAQQALVTVRLSRLQNLVTLYKALGGGWREESVMPSSPG